MPDAHSLLGDKDVIRQWFQWHSNNLFYKAYDDCMYYYVFVYNERTFPLYFSRNKKDGHHILFQNIYDFHVVFLNRTKYWYILYPKLKVHLYHITICVYMFHSLRKLLPQMPMNSIEIRHVSWVVAVSVWIYRP